MDRKEAKELLPIIKAFAEGKKIQYCYKVNGEWQDVKEGGGLTFGNAPSCYRIKPEPKYRPFKNQEECWNEMHKHSNFGWIKGNVTGEYKQIVRIYNYNAELIFNIGYNGSADYSPEMMFSSYTFADGTPFGIKEE